MPGAVCEGKAPLRKNFKCFMLFFFSFLPAVQTPVSDSRASPPAALPEADPKSALKKWALWYCSKYETSSERLRQKTLARAKAGKFGYPAREAAHASMADLIEIIPYLSRLGALDDARCACNALRRALAKQAPGAAVRSVCAKTGLPASFVKQILEENPDLAPPCAIDGQSQSDALCLKILENKFKGQEPTEPKGKNKLMRLLAKAGLNWRDWDRFSRSRRS